MFVICLKFGFKGIQTNIPVTKITAQSVPCFTRPNKVHPFLADMNAVVVSKDRIR